ncbi:hypothetical protein HDU81_010927, partial [Chytriomyces hyalinus]
MGIPMYKTGGSRRRRRSDGEDGGDVRCTRRRRAKSSSSVSSGSSDEDWNGRVPGDRTSDGALVGFLEEYATGAGPASTGDRGGYSPVWMQRMGWADSQGQADPIESNQNANTSFANSSTLNNRRDRFIQTLRAMRNNAVSGSSTLTTLHSSLSAMNTINANIDNMNRSLSIRHSAPSPDDMASVFINADGVESERPSSANNDQNSMGNSPAPRVPMNEETLQSLRQLQRMAIRNRQPSDHSNRLPPTSGDQSYRPSTRSSFRHRQAPDVRSRPAALTSRFNLAPTPTTEGAVTGAFSGRQVHDINITLAPVPARLTASRTAEADVVSSNSFQTGVRNTAFAMERIRHLSDTLARHTAASFSDEESPTTGTPGVPTQSRNSGNLLSSVMFASPRSTLSGPPQRPSSSNSPASASQYTLEGFEIAMARIRERSARHPRTQHPALESGNRDTLLRPLEPIGPAVPVAPTFSGAHLDAVTVDRNAGPFVDPMSPAVFRPIYSNGRARLNRNDSPLGVQTLEGRELTVAEGGSLRSNASTQESLPSASNNFANIVDNSHDTVGVNLPQIAFPNSGPQPANIEPGPATPRSNVAVELQREFTPSGVHRASLHSVIESVLEAVRMPQSPPLAPQFSLDDGISSAFAPALGIVTQASNPAVAPETLLPPSSEIRSNVIDPSPNTANPSTNPQPSTTLLPPPCINLRPSQSGSLWSSLSEAANLAISLSPPLPSSSSSSVCPVNGPGSAGAGVQIQQLSPPLVPLASTASISPSLGPRRPSNFSPGFGPIRRVVSPRVPPNTIAVFGGHGVGVMTSSGSGVGGTASAPLSAGMNVPTELPPAAVETVSSVSGPSAASSASGLQLGVDAPVIGMRRER